MSENPDQIVVSGSPVPDQVSSALRQLALAAGGWAVGRGYLQADTATALGTVMLVAVPAIWGQFHSRKRAKQLARVARSPRVPDSVATIKN